MGCPQNYGPLLVTDDIVAPLFGVPKWDLNVGNYPCVQCLGLHGLDFKATIWGVRKLRVVLGLSRPVLEIPV